MRILVIDDDRMLAESLRHLLTRRGYDVLVCYSGESGLHIATTETPDLVLCDYEMPDINGDEVYNQLPETMKQRFYLFSGYPPLKFAVPERVLDKFDLIDQILSRMGISSKRV